jgi:hypothetical protein
MTALAFLRLPSASEKWPDAANWRTETDMLISTGRDLAQAWPSLLEARNTYASLAALLQNFKGNADDKTFIESVRTTTATLRTQIGDVVRLLDRTKYPFEHAVRGASVSVYMLERMPAPDDLGAIFSAGESIQRQSHLLCHRIAKRLAVIADAIEGPDPIPEPAPVVASQLGCAVVDTA